MNFLSLNKHNTDRKVSVFVCREGNKCCNVNTANQTHSLTEDFGPRSLKHKKLETLQQAVWILLFKKKEKQDKFPWDQFLKIIRPSIFFCSDPRADEMLGADERTQQSRGDDPGYAACRCRQSAGESTFCKSQIRNMMHMKFL